MRFVPRGCISFIVAAAIWGTSAVDGKAQNVEPAPESPSQTPRSLDDSTIQHDSTGQKSLHPFTRLLREGEALAKARDYNRAIESYNRALALGAPTPLAEAIALTYRAGALSRSGKIKEAIADHDRAVSLDSNAFTRWARAETLRKAGRPKEALSDYEIALKLAPDDAAAWVGRGDAFAKLGQHSDAKAAFDRAVSIEPSTHSLMQRAYYLAGRRDFDGAIKDYSSVLQENPGDLLARVNRANAYAERGDLDLAFSDYEAALRNNGPSALVYRGRGWVYEKQGRYDLARADYERAQQLAPNDTWLQKALKKLPKQ